MHFVAQVEILKRFTVRNHKWGSQSISQLAQNPIVDSERANENHFIGAGEPGKSPSNCAPWEITIFAGK
ncbi:hypothetical protein MPTK1_1g27680 [Marchantia polymorpha subsp. ruderalis]|uniref:Uncharacterized protein n=2 Tax=Marchantia polymorpha TaxID=3197 RepID=A0AAF6AUY2_MARPO|nr:hypothetical protein MARPO_0002s0110 [Marchantia polymorpha]BBN00253.1 hypothetical protein Mp_1g27680 [Marchantia polymorpha subsp. ruderalis]|eukprot:PTQ49630.1 hypothetical protein MARPO_0002s0110 [Marchantia polymorpha]